MHQVQTLTFGTNAEAIPGYHIRIFGDGTAKQYDDSEHLQVLVSSRDGQPSDLQAEVMLSLLYEVLLDNPDLKVVYLYKEPKPCTDLSDGRCVQLRGSSQTSRRRRPCGFYTSQGRSRLWRRL